MSDSQENTENCKLRAFEKNNYFYGKLMTVRDFVLEQQYVNDKRWLINNLLFGSGTVCGLNVSSTGTNVFVESGFAIDRCGREIILPEDVSLTLADKDKPSPGNKKAIYISYKECPKERVRAQTASTCDEVCANNRIEESYDIEIRDVQANGSDPTDEELCGIWSNHATKVFDYFSGNVQFRFKRKVKKYVSAGDLFEISLEMTNLNNSQSLSISIKDTGMGQETLPSGLLLVEGSNTDTINIPPGETIKKWYVVKVDANPPEKFTLIAKINDTSINDTASIIEVKSPREISEKLIGELIDFWTKPCLEDDIDSGVKIAELSLGTDGLENQKIIVDNTRRKLVNNNKYMTKMLECLRAKSSALEDQSVYIKNKIAPSQVMISASPSEIDADGEQVSSITINVRNDAGIGLPDIYVNLISTLGNIIHLVRTGPDGSATAILTSGTIPGNASVMATTGIGSAVTQVAFRSTTGNIEGFIIDKTDDTKIITGAIVSVGTITTVTDSESHYSLKNVPHGTQVVWAFASGYEKESSLVDVKANQVNWIDIPLTPISTTGTITGRVTDKDGNVIGNIVKVTAGGITATADETGNYTLSNVPAGTHTVTASADGYQTQNRASVVVTADGTTSGIDFKLEKATGTIKGRVTEFSRTLSRDLTTENLQDTLTPVKVIPVSPLILPLPKGIEGATVSVLGTSKSVLTDASGNYEIKNVPLGTQTVFASALNYNASTSSVLVEANKTIPLNFELKPLVTTGTVTGRVTTLKRQITRTIGTGAITATRTVDPGLIKAIDTTIIKPIDPIIICVSGSPLSSPVEEVGIEGAIVTVAGKSAVTDATGNYIIKNVPEGSQDLSVSAAGYVAQRTTVTVTPGGTATANFQLVIAVSRGMISGRVTKFTPLIKCLSGMPVDAPQSIGIMGAVVSVAGTSLSAITDDSGNYSISDVPTGTYTVNASAKGYNTGTQGATVNENSTTTVNFQLVPLPTTGEITGKVTDKNGNPLFTATVNLVDVGDSVITDKNGTYRFPNVRPGSHTVGVNAAGYLNSERTVTVIAGQVTIADFVMNKWILGVVGEPGTPVPDTTCLAAIPGRIDVLCTGATPFIASCISGGPTAEPPIIDRPVVGTPVIDRPVIGTPVIDRPVIGTPVVDRPVVGTPVVERTVVGTPVIGKKSGTATACPGGRPTIAPIKETLTKFKAKKGKKK